MYTLYYSPGSCSIIIHCLLEELAVPFETHRVSTEKGEHRTRNTAA
jgi:glutathione S-transferase